jgi:hypothetical protein
VLFVRSDRRIADLMLARAQRRWPLLRLVPRPYIRAVILPAATLARQDVAVPQPAARCSSARCSR